MKESGFLPDIIKQQGSNSSPDTKGQKPQPKPGIPSPFEEAWVTRKPSLL